LLPDPLHPAVVHFPVALAALVPLVAALVLIAIRAGRASAASWTLVVLLQALFAASAWLAHETGHEQEERVEKIVEGRHIEEHEQAADWLLRLSVVGLAAAGLGLAAGNAGAWGRGLAFALSLATLAAAVRTGYLGGELVYRYGAANAYVEQPAGSARGTPQEP
jgi:uncharacterized membrane protein